MLKRIISAPLLASVISISAAESSPATSSSPTPSPDQEAQLLKEVKVPSQFEAKIFAVPPAVNYPVFVAASPDGILYVSSDRNGSLDRAPHRGRVLRVRDLDGDGHADEVKAFVPDVDSPRGLAWDRDRLYLLHPPHLSVFIDHDGDGIADEEKVLVKNIAFGFKDRPADHSSNGIELGIDGWIYCAIGDFGFMEAEGTDGRKLQLRGGGVVRVRPDGSELELYSRGTRNILEACVSPRLEIFARDNTNDGDGWDIRLHHFTGLSEHGYPSLFKNFKGEFIEPLADYGGGSGCGGLYLSEPGFPEGFGEALYTSDWGREWVYRHNLTPNGATFSAEQAEFVRAPRVTDLDVDAMGRIYVSSWKGATFTYVGENVGFLVQVTPKGYKAEPLLDFRKASEAELIAVLESPSHRRRLAAQRELLSRDLREISKVEALANNSKRRVESRIAALYLLKQKQGEGSHPLLAQLLHDPEMQEYAIHALCDRTAQMQLIPREQILASLRSDQPRVRLEAAFGLARIGDPATAGPISMLFGDSDPVVRHTGIQAVRKLDGVGACFAVLDSPGSSDLERNGAIQVLERIHRADVVDGLLSRLEKSDAMRQRPLITALARLHDRMGEWKGDSWGTRPDTTGPYYQPVTWEQTERITEALKQALKNAAGEDAVFIAHELGRNKIADPDISQTMVHLAERDESLLPVTIAQLARSSSTPPEAEKLLVSAASSPNVPSATRANAITALCKTTHAESFGAILTGMAALQHSQDGGREVLQARQAFLRLNATPERIDFCKTEAGALHGDSSVWADAFFVSHNITNAVESGWREPARRVQLLKAITVSEHRASRERVLEALEDQDPEVVAEAKKAARALRIDRERPNASEKQIASFAPEDVLRRVAALKGDPKLGAEIFNRQTCSTCHTISPTEPLRGPFLGNIATIYKRDELATAILFPNKTIAQGFATYRFNLKEGEDVEGFVTQESGSGVTVRNITGQELTLPTSQIAARTKLEKSLMPEGLAGNLTLKEFASLLDYLVELSNQKK